MNHRRSLEINLVGSDAGNPSEGVDLRLVYNVEAHTVAVVPPKGE